MTNLREILRILDMITYKPNAGFFANVQDVDSYWIQHWQNVTSAFDRQGMLSRPTLQKGRKWRISKHMTQSEIVQTCLAAVLQFEEHEARENFRVAGHACYSPHLDVNALIEVAERKEIRHENSDHRKSQPR